MKNQLALAVVGVGLAMGGNAIAGTITFGNGWGSAGGGEFNVTASDDFGAFKTFCLEYTQPILIPGTYNYVINPSDRAVSGGADSEAAPGDPISIGTAYLYSQFAAGTLAGYSQALENDLQKAIWWLEEEPAGENNAYVALAKTDLGGLTDAQVRAAAGGAYGVVVLNLDGYGVADIQDVLAVTPVPDGGLTLGMLGAGLVTLGLARRRLA